MRRQSLLVLMVALAFSACGDDGGAAEEEEFQITFPHTVTLQAEQALVALTGEVIEHADFISGDLVTFTNQSIKIQTGCPENLAHCQPLHVCRPSPSSKPEKFTSLMEVCMNDPTEDEASIIANAEQGMGFTIRLNNADGYGRFWVKEVSGLGGSATITLEYMLFHMAE